MSPPTLIPELDRPADLPLPPAAGTADPEVIDLTEVTFALSDALDLVGVASVQHGKRVACMAGEIARFAGLAPEERDDLFLSALLHDCGVSTTGTHRQLVSHFDWEGAPGHCRRGADLLGSFAPFRAQAQVVLYHHTRWDDPVLQALPTTVAIPANLIHLADRVDVLLAWSKGADPLLARHDVLRTIGSFRGSFFSPELVDAFVAASEPEAFWLTLESHHLERFLVEEMKTARPRPGGPDTLRQLARLFARVVDGKSPFTADHSFGVSRLAGLLGRLAGLTEETCGKLELAGLLHDLGKLRVPDEVLDKPAPLDDAEFASMERHTFETWQILRRIAPLREIAPWAAWHHEKMSGRGYPFHRRDGEIPFPARVVAVADVFQALAQDRPYRASLPPTQIVRILREMAGNWELDEAVVELAARNADDCWAAAVGHPAGVLSVRDI